MLWREVRQEIRRLKGRVSELDHPLGSRTFEVELLKEPLHASR
jgi:hypothetical protein